MTEESPGKKGTSCSEMKSSDNSNAQKRPTKDFDPYKDFHESRNHCQRPGSMDGVYKHGLYSR